MQNLPSMLHFDDAENSQLNFSSIQMDEGIGFVQRRTYNKLRNREKEIYQCDVCQRTSND